MPIMKKIKKLYINQINKLFPFESSLLVTDTFTDQMYAVTETRKSYGKY